LSSPSFPSGSIPVGVSRGRTKPRRLHHPASRRWPGAERGAAGRLGVLPAAWGSALARLYLRREEGSLGGDQGTAKPRRCLLLNPQLGAGTCGAPLLGGRRRSGAEIPRSHGPHGSALLSGSLLGLGAWLSPRPCPPSWSLPGLWLLPGCAVGHPRRWEPEAGAGPGHGHRHCRRAQHRHYRAVTTRSQLRGGFGQSFHMKLPKTRGPKLEFLVL